MTKIKTSTRSVTIILTELPDGHTYGTVSGVTDTIIFEALRSFVSRVEYEVSRDVHRQIGKRHRHLHEKSLRTVLIEKEHKLQETIERLERANVINAI